MLEKATKQIGRRHFLRKCALAAGGIGVIGNLAPNLIINPMYAGTALIVDSTGTDYAVELSNASFARPFSLGTWSIMRIALRIASEMSASLTSLTPRLVVGLCSGSTNQVFDASTTNFVGVRSVNATWTYNASSPDYFGLATSPYKPTTRVNTTWTDGTTFSSTQGYLQRASEYAGSQYWGTLLVEIERGDPNYSLKMQYNSSTSLINMTRNDWLAQMVAVTPTITNALAWPGAQTIAASEAAGAFNHVQVGWDRSEATILIEDLVLIKMAA